MDSILTKIRIRSPLLRESLAEFLGTFILVLFGDASVAQFVLYKKDNGDFFSVNWGWGIAVMIGVLIAGGVSGAHLNPAVSLAMAFFGRLSPIKVIAYWLAQYLGAFVAASCVLGVYNDAIKNFIPPNNAPADPIIAGIFTTFPAPGVSTIGAFFDQIVGTMLLLLGICAICEKRNLVPKYVVPIYVGLLIIAIGVCFGANCGYAINPARDLAPRLLMYIAGRNFVFSYKDTYFWVPIVGPHIGAILGVLIYIVFVEAHWKEESDKDIRCNWSNPSNTQESEQISMEDV